MHVTIDCYDLVINVEEIKLFYESFVNCNSSIIFKQFGKEIQTYNYSNEEMPKTNKSLEQSLSQLGFMRNCQQAFLITVLKSATLVDIIFDKFYSLSIGEEDVERTLKDLLAKLFGYEACDCFGFTVKNKEGKKIQPRETIYVKNTLGFVFPKEMVYTKQETNLKPIYKVKVVCFGPILWNILASTSLNFIKEDCAFTLSLENKFLYLSVFSAFENSNFLDGEKKKIENLKGWLKANDSPLIGMLTNIYIDRDSTRKISKIKQTQMDWLNRFITVVPLFHYERDLQTQRLMQIYDKHKSQQSVKHKCDYLRIKTKKYIDRVPIGSIKEWEVGE